MHYDFRLSFACNLFAVAALWLGGLLPSAPVWESPEAYLRILGYTPRILAASFVAVMIGEFVNAHLRPI